MFWWIFIGVSAVLMIVGIIFCFCSWKLWDTDWIFTVSIILTSIFGIAFILSAITVPLVKIDYDKQLEVFKQQKYYIEQIVPTLPETDNYAITTKRIELNDWLYNAQYEIEHFGFFTLYSDEILDLEPIK